MADAMATREAMIDELMKHRKISRELAEMWAAGVIDGWLAAAARASWSFPEVPDEATGREIVRHTLKKIEEAHT